MCGVIAVLRRSPTRPVPVGAELLAALQRAQRHLTAGGAAHIAGSGASGPGSHVTGGNGPGLAGLAAASAEVVAVDLALRGVPGVRLLVGDAGVVAELQEHTARLEASLATLEQRDHMQSGVILLVCLHTMRSETLHA